MSDNYGGVTAAMRYRMANMVVRAFRPFGVAKTMLCIVNRESGFNPRAANWRDSNGGSFGLFQINGIHKHRGETIASFSQRMFIPKNNINQAVRLYATSGLAPWGGGC